MQLKEKVKGLSEYNLDAVDLRNNNYICEAKIDFDCLEVDSIRHLSIKERKKEYVKYLRDTLNVVSKIFQDYTIRGTTQKPGGIAGKFNSKDLYNLSKNNRIKYIDIDKIVGLKKHLLPSQNEKGWYNVICHYVIQVENLSKGQQTHEMRHLLVRARSYEEAENKARKESKQYGAPYFNHKFELVRCHLVEIVDSKHVEDYNSIEQLRDEVIEVYSELLGKNFKREFFWDGK